MSIYIIPIGLGIINFALVYLTFVNDEHLAGVFHGEAWAWGLVIHAAILFMPAINAFLPEGEERDAGQFIWKACIALAYLGNVIGSIAFASGVPVRDVLSGSIPIGPGLIFASVAGGLLLPTMEAKIGWLFEKRFAAMADELSRWLAGPSDIPATATTIDHRQHFEFQPEPQPMPAFVPPPLEPKPQPTFEVATPSNIIPFQGQAPQPQPKEGTLSAQVKALLDSGATDNATLYAALGATTPQQKNAIRATASKLLKKESVA